MAHSPLVKTALFASDANWGRILAAVGRARVKGISFENINISLNEVQIISSGEISEQYTEEAGSREMEKPEITLRIRYFFPSGQRGTSSAQDRERAKNE